MTTIHSATASVPASTTPGRKAFIIKFGILGWGIPCALLTTAWDWYFGLPVSELGVSLAIRLVLFGIVGGIAFGAAMWKVSQRIRTSAVVTSASRS